MRRKNRGFTLVELLLYGGLLSILIFSTTIFLTLILQTRTKNQVITEVEQQGALVLVRLMQVVRNSVLINTPATGASGSSLSVSMPQAALNPTVFALSSGVITMTQGASSAVSLTNNLVSVTGLTFSNVSRASTPGTARVQFTVSYINNSGRNEFDYSKTFDSDVSLRDN